MHASAAGAVRGRRRPASAGKSGVQSTPRSERVCGTAPHTCTDSQTLRAAGGPRPSLPQPATPPEQAEHYICKQPGTQPAPANSKFRSSSRSSGAPLDRRGHHVAPPAHHRRRHTTRIVTAAALGSAEDVDGNEANLRSSSSEGTGRGMHSRRSGHCLPVGRRAHSGSRSLRCVIAHTNAASAPAPTS